MEKPALPIEGYVRQPTVLAHIPFSKSTLWLKIKRGEFPAPVKLSERITAWEVSSIRQWMAERNKAAA